MSATNRGKAFPVVELSCDVSAAGGLALVVVDEGPVGAGIELQGEMLVAERDWDTVKVHGEGIATLLAFGGRSGHSRSGQEIRTLRGVASPLSWAHVLDYFSLTRVSNDVKVKGFSIVRVGDY